MRLESGEAGSGMVDLRPQVPQHHELQSEEMHELHPNYLAGGSRQMWPPEWSDQSSDMGRQASSFATSSVRHGPYDTLSALPYRRSPQRHEYDGRPLSSSEALPTVPNLFSAEPYMRATSAVPFDSHYIDHPRPRVSHTLHQGRIDALRDLPDRRLSQLLTKPEGLAEADPQILVPIVSVTPECRTVEGDVNSFWVAVELVAQITKPLHTGSTCGYRFRQDFRHASTSTFTTDDDQGGLDNLMPSFITSVLPLPPLP